MEAKTDKKEAQPRLRDLTKAFAKRIVKLNLYLQHQVEPQELVMSQHVALCGTTIGASVLKAEMSGTDEGYRQGISQALDNATETQYWLELLAESGYLTAEQSKSINDDLRHILNILWKIVKAKKKQEGQKSEEAGGQQSEAETMVPMEPEEQRLYNQIIEDAKPKRGRKPKQILLDVGKAFLLPLLMSLSLLLTGCYQSPTLEVVEEMSKEGQMVNVKVSLSGLDITEAESRASDKSATDAKITNIDLKVLDAEGNAVETISQTSTEAEFGSLSLKLPIGTYTFVAVANGASTASTITSSTEATAPENAIVYSCSQSETISGNSTQTVSLDMGTRKNACFRIKITDATPSDVDAIQLIIAPTATAPSAVTFSPTTGFASSTWRYERTFTKGEFNLTTFTNQLLSYYLLLTAAEKQLDVTINALSAEDSQTHQRTILYTRALTSVTFRQAYQTTASGTFFSSATSGSFLFDTTFENITISLD